MFRGYVVSLRGAVGWPVWSSDLSIYDYFCEVSSKKICSNITLTPYQNQEIKNIEEVIAIPRDIICNGAVVVPR